MIKALFSKTYSFLKEYNYPLAIFIASRAMIFLVLLLAGAYGLAKEPTIYNWDARHYLSIAQNGYEFSGQYDNKGSLIAFFPLYPITISVLHAVSGWDFDISGLILSFIFGLGSAILLYRLVFDWRNKETAIMAVTLFSFFPSSVFLSSTYTESLFIFLSLLAFYFISRKREGFAIIAVALSTVTRITGSVLAIVYVWDLWKRTKNIWKVIVYGLLISIPFALFLYFQYIQYGIPFAFLNAHSAFWRNYAVLPWTGLWMFFYSVFTETDYVAMWRTNAVYLIVMIIVMIFSWKKIPRNIWLFGLGVIILNLCSSFIMSMERVMIPVLPFYFYFGEILSRHKVTGQIVMIFSAGWMVFNVVLFVIGSYLL